MSWMKFEIDDRSATSVADFQEIFWSFFAAAGGPKTAALYSQRAYSSVTTVFVSPAGTALMGSALEGFGAVSCGRPESDSVIMLVGNDSARDTTFAA